MLMPRERVLSRAFMKKLRIMAPTCRSLQRNRFLNMTREPETADVVVGSREAAGARRNW